MPQIEIVESTPVVFPDLRRELYDTDPHVRGVTEFDETDLAQYDRHTIFHDVYLSHDNTRLLAVGPALLNLRRHVLPVRVRMSDAGSVTPGGTAVERRLRVWRYRNCTLASLAIPEALQGRDLQLDLRFGRTPGSGREISRVATAARWPHVDVALGTMQKDNPARWIGDWIRYHAALGVKRVVLYDNNSADLPGLVAALERVDAPAAVTVVRWNHPFGMVRCHGNKFCQIAALNHCHSRFGGCDWMLNLDVDEYLVFRHAAAGSPAAADWLARRHSHTGLVQFDSHDMRALPDTLPEDYSARDITTREHKLRRRSKKYAIRPAARAASAPHRARLRLGWWRKRVPPAEALFLHLLPLGLAWKSRKPAPGTRGVKPVDPATIVQDTAIRDVFDWLDRP